MVQASNQTDKLCVSPVSTILTEAAKILLEKYHMNKMKINSILQLESINTC